MTEKIVPDKKNFERINYSLRPAKHIERKMFCETFGRLSILDNIKNYRYIGMGSAYFSDFSLFHKTLGINKLISIEGEDDTQSKRRIKFNKPFACIDVEFGWTDKILPVLSWSKWQEKSIVWLDYVDKLKESMFGDIETVLFNVKAGSIFLISVNIEEDDERDKKTNPDNLGAKEFRFKMLCESVGRESIPKRVDDMVLNINENKSIIREIIDTAFHRVIKKRNSGVGNEDRVEYKQLFNLHYKDTADMLTVGGIIFNKHQKEKVDEMFDHLDFIRNNDDCFSIVVPKLTYREIHALDKVLPHITGKSKNTNKSELSKIPVSSIDKRNYARIYRYFPTFAETNL
jgi:hypothetical protein